MACHSVGQHNAPLSVQSVQLPVSKLMLPVVLTASPLLEGSRGEPGLAQLSIILCHLQACTGKKANMQA